MHELHIHFKQYFIDAGIILTALSAKIYAYFTGMALVVGNLHVDKIVYVSVMMLTGFTTLYRFIKEVKADRKQKREQKENDLLTKNKKTNYHEN